MALRPPGALAACPLALSRSFRRLEAPEPGSPIIRALSPQFIGDRQDVDPLDHRGFKPILFGDEDALEAGLARRDGQRQHGADGLDATECMASSRVNRGCSMPAASTMPAAARTPKAIGRSKAAPFFSAEARLTVEVP